MEVETLERMSGRDGEGQARLLTIFFAFHSDLATLRSGIAFQVLAMFQRARFFVFGAGTSGSV